MRLNEFLLNEARIDSKRRKLGEVKFPASDINDPHIQRATQEILRQHPEVSQQDWDQHVQAKMAEFEFLKQKSPILYETMAQNNAEQTVFTEFWKSGTRIQGAPQFSNKAFYRIVSMLQAEYPELFPLQSYIDKRHLTNPNFHIFGVDDAQDDPQKAMLTMQIPTAAASPNGDFYFNRDFMQSLLDYAHLKGVKPKDGKYKSNGGPIPDEYAWIEFVIMHEFMHYTNDDFYYQKLIPNADPKIINWVGDMRTNYFLTKNGFEALPMGLFSDQINFDRQTSYREMYDLIKGEFDKLNEEEQEKVSEEFDKRMDDHDKGNEEGAKKNIKPKDGEGGEPGEPGEGEGDGDEGDDAAGGGGAGEGAGAGGDAEEIDPKELDKMVKKTGDKVEKTDTNTEKPGADKAERGDPSMGQGDGPGKGGKNKRAQRVEMNVEPRFNWQQLIGKFIKSGAAKTEETYARPARRSITTMDVARQVGAAAIKPAEIPSEFSQAKLMFILDTSGSMHSILATVMASARKLLKHPMFKNAAVLVGKFSDESSLFRVNVARNQAAQVETVVEKPTQWPLTGDQVLSTGNFGGTTISPELVKQSIEAIKQGHNIIMFSDSDALDPWNYKQLMAIVRAGVKTGQVFIIFDTLATYRMFRQKTGITSENFTAFQ